MRYFTQRDFDKATPTCSINDMDPELMEMLDIARHFAGIPIIINSAYRDLGWELQSGRDGKSSHTKGVAVDIAVESPRNRFLILNGLMKAGFTRLGISESFIHADIDACLLYTSDAADE